MFSPEDEGSAYPLASAEEVGFLASISFMLLTSPKVEKKSLSSVSVSALLTLESTGKPLKYKFCLAIYFLYLRVRILT